MTFQACGSVNQLPWPASKSSRVAFGMRWARAVVFSGLELPS